MKKIQTERLTPKVNKIMPSQYPVRNLIFKLIDVEADRTVDTFQTFGACFAAKGRDQSLVCEAAWITSPTRTK